jgi:hypothetical protein
VSFPALPASPKKPPKKASPKRASPKARRAPRVVERIIERRGDSGRTTIAPSQQVSVPVTNTSPGIGILAAKIGELLKAKPKTKRKKNTHFTQAKKQYKAVRTKRINQVKTENKDIRKREAAKIKKLPTKDRPAARKKLTAALKARLTKIKKEMPSKIETPAQLSNLIKGIRTLKV